MEDLSATNIHDVKRQTAKVRSEKIRDLIVEDQSEQWLIWCDTDYEADHLKKIIPNAIEIRGSMSPEKKEEGLTSFLDSGNLITKPSIAGMGVNWQHCARVAYVGRNFSYESFYQSVRRCWRFGQLRPVEVHLIVAEGEDQIGRVIDRKAETHSEMKTAMAAAMIRAREKSSKLKVTYNPTHIGRLPTWLKSVA
jgi:hypothetical protein